MSEEHQGWTSVGESCSCKCWTEEPQSRWGQRQRLHFMLLWTETPESNRASATWRLLSLLINSVFFLFFPQLLLEREDFIKVLASVTFFSRHQQKIADLCSVWQQNGHHLIVICVSICLSMFITNISSGSTTQRCMHTNTQTQILSTFKMTQATTEMVQWRLESSTPTCHSKHVRKWKGTLCARLFLSSMILTSFKICL